MRISGKHIIISLLTVLAAASCNNKVTESIDSLCTGYWVSTSEAGSHLSKFRDDGSLFGYVFRYEKSEDRYYCYYDSSANTKYMLDAGNGMLCLFPDKWHYIYVLTPRSLVLSADDDEVLKFGKVPDSRVTVMSEANFNSKYPK